MEQDLEPKKKPTHYYGDIVRVLFMSAAVIMLIGLPAIRYYLKLPSIFAVFFILVLGFAAGLTNPKQIWDSGLNMVVAIIGFVISESYSIWAYSSYPANNKFVLTTLVLSLLFLFAVYFSVKTFRGLMIEQKEKEENPDDEHTYPED